MATESKHTAFHWPDHTIGKRESRHIREAHNALYNDFHALLAALERHADVDQDTCDCDLYDVDAGELCIACDTRAAIAKATKGE